MSKAAGGAGRPAHHSDKMVCVVCYNTKTDREMSSSLCQNPKCQFYVSSSECSPTTCDDIFGDDVFHDNVSPAFFKEVGHSKKTGPALKGPLSTLGSDKLSTMWVYQPTNSHPSSQPAGPGFKPRLKSSSFPGERYGWQKMLNNLDESTFNGESRKFSNIQHPRLRSFPGHMDTYLKHEGNGITNDIVLASPSKHNILETEQDINGSCYYPHGNSSGSDSPASNTSSSHLPAVSSVASASDMFDMTCLKLEMSRISDSHARHQSLASYDEVLPESFPSVTPGLSFPFGLNRQYSETYSRKVFIGGLPPDLDEGDIRMFFISFGSVTIDWPHKSHSKSCFPPKGYAFLLYKNESSVHKLLLSCFQEGDKHFLYMPASGILKRKVEVRPWYIADSCHIVDSSKNFNSRKAVFVGGVPRPLKASELAEVMAEKFGDVAFVMIDSDCDLRYPKGAACVAFVSHDSYIAAISSRFMQLNYGSIDKKVEIKPYILDGQMCDECNGIKCNGKPAPFFCGNIMCLRYYCEQCWSVAHSLPGRQNHRPLLKDVGDKSKFF